MIRIDIKNDQITPGLARLAAALDDPSPVMKTIGDILTISTKKRFGQGVSPDGAAWAAKSPVTLARHADARPLFGPSNQLNEQIFPESGADFVEVGSIRVYAAMMQFGGRKSAYPHLWGDIPARPFLGVSKDDEVNILAEIEDYLTGAVRP